MSDLIETLLDADERDAQVGRGVSVAAAVMSAGGVAEGLLAARQLVGEREAARELVLAELAAAVSLQRFRFAERQSNGECAFVVLAERLT